MSSCDVHSTIDCDAVSRVGPSDAAAHAVVVVTSNHSLALRLISLIPDCAVIDVDLTMVMT